MINDEYTEKNNALKMFSLYLNDKEIQEKALASLLIEGQVIYFNMLFYKELNYVKEKDDPNDKYEYEMNYKVFFFIINLFL